MPKQLLLSENISFKAENEYLSITLLSTFVGIVYNTFILKTKKIYIVPTFGREKLNCHKVFS